MEILIEHLGRGILLVLLLSLPPVLTAASVGLVVGILQAVTQVQEQTIAAAPKIISVFLVILVGGGLMMGLLSDYVRDAVLIAFTHLPQDGIFILPPDSKEQEGYQRARAFFKAQSHSGDSKMKEFLNDWQSKKDDPSSTATFHVPNSNPDRASHPEKLFLQAEENR